MAITTPRRVWNQIGISVGVALLFLELSIGAASVSAQTVPNDDLIQQAAEHEKHHDWLDACRLYYELFRRHRDDVRFRQAYQRCLRRYHIVHRHQDKLYLSALERLTPAQALEMYDHVLETIGRFYTDRQKSSPAALFARGFEELRLAFEEPVFLHEYFPGITQEKLNALRKKLGDWRPRKIGRRSEARDQVGAVGRTVQQIGSLTQPFILTVVTLEFLNGACNALDEYTFFLTPGSYRDVQALLRGRPISIGVDVDILDDQLVIRRVYPNSPAKEAGLMAHDRIVSIDGQSTGELTVEKAAELLRGKSGTRVRLEIVSHAEPMFVQVKEIKRAPVMVPSVEWELLDTPILVDLGDGMKGVFPIGKLTINYFQESTLQEVKDALTDLQNRGMKVLILDLRRNPGGLFKSAVEVAELFLPEGIIVVSQTHIPYRDRKLRGTIRAEQPDALLIPMVVFIDGETASSAEVLAGALKDNGRAKLIGQTTYGKGTIQSVIKLDDRHFERMPAGIRITVAKLLSPNWQPYSGKGIEPNSPCVFEGMDIPMEARHLLLRELQKSLQPMSH